MRNEILTGTLLALLAGPASIASADDTPAPAASAPTQSTPAQPAPAAPEKKPAPAPAAAQPAPDDTVGADYDKNAAKRFTPTERAPADRNISFPVDI